MAALLQEKTALIAPQLLSFPGKKNLLEEALQNPQRLGELSAHELPILCARLRNRLIQSVSESGGHFAAGLGALELTVALHHVLDTPEDRVVWDVGHQTYPHKILTGRGDMMHSIRKLGGLSGFPCRSESEFDAFGVAHAGTSISAALGMAVAGELDSKHRRRVVAVIGDGALTSGMAFEALNHAGDIGTDLLVILNDNGMSISRNVGALATRFAPLHRGRKADDPGALFRALGFSYRGPVDGHDVCSLVDTLNEVVPMYSPRLLHVITRKGCGYDRAENDPVRYHAVGCFDAEKGPIRTVTSDDSAPTFTQVFSEWLSDSAESNDRLVAVTPAMIEGSGLRDFQQRFADRCFDTGITEQHAVTFAAGLACEGFRPVVAIYSTFLQRGYDQLIHDVALQKLPVLFAIDRAGLVGADGATHHGHADLSFLRSVPNIVIMCPSDQQESRRMLQTGLQHPGPAAVRYPRGKGNCVEVTPDCTPLEIGRARQIRHGKGIAILAFGPILHEALPAADELNATVIDMRFVKPLDVDLITSIARSHDLIVTVEDNVVAGGAGSAVNEVLAPAAACPILNLGLPDDFVGHGTQQQLHKMLGLDSEGIVHSIRSHLGTVS